MIDPFSITLMALASLGSAALVSYIDSRLELKRIKKYKEHEAITKAKVFQEIEKINKEMDNIEKTLKQLEANNVETSFEQEHLTKCMKYSTINE